MSTPLPSSTSPTSPTSPARWSDARRRAAAAAGKAAGEGYAQLARFYRWADLDRWDSCCALGLALLALGLWVWIGFGVAMTIVGGLVLRLGVLGARNTASAAGAGGGAGRGAGG